MRDPEIVVYRRGLNVDRIVWRWGDKEVDLGPAPVSKVERIIEIQERPSVKVTFRARLVEVEV